MWYVVHAAEGTEAAAIEKCRNAIPTAIATKIFSPDHEFMRRYQGAWHIKVGKLFPGYIFIESEYPEELLAYLEHIPGTVTPVCIGGFTPIRDDEEAFLRDMMDETYCIRYSLGYIVDGTLIVEKGPLCGKTSHVRKVDRHTRTADILFFFFGEEHRARVGLEVPAKMTAEEYEQSKSKMLV